MLLFPRFFRYLESSALDISKSTFFNKEDLLSFRCPLRGGAWI